MLRRREVSIETNFKEKIVKWGALQGLPIYVLKLSILGFRGWPDRLVVWPKGNVLFIEFKRPGEVPRKLQNYVHDIIRELGFAVEVFDDEFTALETVKRRIQATTCPSPRNETDSGK